MLTNIWWRRWWRFGLEGANASVIRNSARRDNMPSGDTVDGSFTSCIADMLGMSNLNVFLNHASGSCMMFRMMSRDEDEAIYALSTLFSDAFVGSVHVVFYCCNDACNESRGD